MRLLKRVLVKECGGSTCSRNSLLLGGKRKRKVETRGKISFINNPDQGRIVQPVANWVINVPRNTRVIVTPSSADSLQL